MKRQSIPRVAARRQNLFAATRPHTLSVATDEDRETIYRLRHDVYAYELGQHAVNGDGSLADALDAWNIYLVVKVGRDIAGFISLTPPGSAAYSIDKYFVRESLPFPVDNQLFEVRLLTVLKPHRGRELAALLGVSRTSVREAIISLEIAGLVEVRVGTGIFVTPGRPAADGDGDKGPGPFELLNARKLVEGEIAALAATPPAEAGA